MKRKRFKALSIDVSWEIFMSHAGWSFRNRSVPFDRLLVKSVKIVGDDAVAFGIYASSHFLNSNIRSSMFRLNTKRFERIIYD